MAFYSRMDEIHPPYFNINRNWDNYEHGSIPGCITNNDHIFKPERIVKNFIINEIDLILKKIFFKYKLFHCENVNDNGNIFFYFRKTRLSTKENQEHRKADINLFKISFATTIYGYITAKIYLLDKDLKESITSDKIYDLLNNSGFIDLYNYKYDIKQLKEELISYDLLLKDIEKILIHIQNKKYYGKYYRKYDYK